MRRRIHVCHIRRRIHVSYEEEDTCVSYEEEDIYLPKVVFVEHAPVWEPAAQGLIYQTIARGIPEVRTSVKRDLIQRQKRPNTEAKET
jgi:hypothetical protein